MKKGTILYKSSDVTINPDHVKNCIDHNGTQRCILWWDDEIHKEDFSNKSAQALLDFVALHQDHDMVISFQDRYPMNNESLMPYSTPAKGDNYFHYFHAGDLAVSPGIQNEDVAFYQSFIEPLSKKGKIATMQEWGRDARNGSFLAVHKGGVEMFGHWIEADGIYYSGDEYSRPKPNYYHSPPAYYSRQSAPATNTPTQSPRQLGWTTDKKESTSFFGAWLELVPDFLRNYFKLPASVKFFVAKSENDLLHPMDFVLSVSGNKDITEKSLNKIESNKNPSAHVTIIRYDQPQYSISESLDDCETKKLTIVRKSVQEKTLKLTPSQRLYLAKTLAESVAIGKYEIQKKQNEFLKLAASELVERTKHLNLKLDTL